MKYNIANIGNRLKAERKKAGIKSQNALAEYLNQNNYRSYTRQTISKWEHGLEMPPLDVLITLCDLFNCELGYLLCEYDCKTREKTDIHKMTGLSEAAIDILCNWNNIGNISAHTNYSWARNSLHVLSDLLERDMLLVHEVLLPIKNYVVNRLSYAAPDSELKSSNFTRKDFLDKYQLALFTASTGLTRCADDIYKKKKEL